jgi:hypothetical protein
MTVTLPAACSCARPAALGCQTSRGSSVNAVPPVSLSVGRRLRYRLSWYGASTLSESIPPDRNTDTSTGCGPAVCAIATPSSRTCGARRSAPYTDSATPAVRSTNDRRLRPVPAGVGMPASTAGSPRLARA